MDLSFETRLKFESVNLSARQYWTQIEKEGQSWTRNGKLHKNENWTKLKNGQKC